MMIKGTYYIKMKHGYESIDGYIFEVDGTKYGVAHTMDKDVKPLKTWTVTHIDSGYAVTRYPLKRRADAEPYVVENVEVFRTALESDLIKDAVRELYAYLNEDDTKDEVSEDAECSLESDVERLDKLGTWEKRLSALLQYAMKYHPSRGGTDEVWARFVETYKKNYDLTKDMHLNVKGEVYCAETRETAEQMINIVNNLADCAGLTCEVVGRFIWTGGEQKPYTKILKSLGFTYQSNKRKWCRSYDGYTRRGRKRYSYSQIKTMYKTADEEA